MYWRIIIFTLISYMRWFFLRFKVYHGTMRLEAWPKVRDRDSNVWDSNVLDSERCQRGREWERERERGNRLTWLNKTCFKTSFQTGSNFFKDNALYHIVPWWFTNAQSYSLLNYMTFQVNKKWNVNCVPTPTQPGCRHKNWKIARFDLISIWYTSNHCPTFRL